LCVDKARRAGFNKEVDFLLSVESEGELMVKRQYDQLLVIDADGYDLRLDAGVQQINLKVVLLG
jgi:hypothetical protein